MDAQKRNLLLLLVAAIAAAGLLFFVFQSSQNEAARDESKAQEQWKEKDKRDAETFAKSAVVYAAKDIPAGARFSAEMFERTEELNNRIPAGAISRPDEAIGGTAAYPIKQGTIILHNSVKP